MSKAAALSAVPAPVPAAEVQELVVTIQVDDATGEVRADPSELHVPSGFRGYIRWRIDHPNAVFEETPIVFNDGPRTVPPPATEKTCHVWWENANGGSEATAYSYMTMLQHGLRHVNPDPTVENDPPGFVA
jgi:hypothetical protein